LFAVGITKGEWGVRITGAPLAFILGLSVIGCSQKPPSTSRQDNQNATIAMSDGTLELRGKKLALPFPPEELTSLLGNPDRTTNLISTILTWDELGLYAYVDPKTKMVVNFYVAFQNDGVAFTPKKLYSGKLLLDGAEVTVESTIDGINEARKGTPFKTII
jgi:hypothetical protein